MVEFHGNGCAEADPAPQPRDVGYVYWTVATTRQPEAPRRPSPPRSGSAPERARQALFGSETRFGLWLVPMFLMAGLLGATLAGGLAVLYYGQQVSRLESETSDARAQAAEARDEVIDAAAGAEESIEAQLRRAREELATDAPVSSPNETGIYAVSADHGGGEVRVGSAFALFSSDDQTILLTTHALVENDGGAIRGVDVFFPNQSVTARVHNFDPDLDLATLVVNGGPVPVPEWRPADEPVSRGDPLWVAGVAGPGTVAVLEGNVAGVSERALVPDVPLNAFLAGAPLVDASARVVGVASLAYAPFGEVPGDLAYGVPIRAVCDDLIRCTDEDITGLGDEGGDEADGDDAPEPGGE
jgi:S1-C subfamily serine protease